MRRIKQLMTSHFGAGASARSVAQELGIAPSTVREYLGRVTAAGIGWPPTMRQQHAAGHKAFVDYSGTRVAITDSVAGQVRTTEVFMVVLGGAG